MQSQRARSQSVLVWPDPLPPLCWFYTLSSLSAWGCSSPPRSPKPPCGTTSRRLSRSIRTYAYRTSVLGLSLPAKLQRKVLLDAVKQLVACVQLHVEVRRSWRSDLHWGTSVRLCQISCTHTHTQNIVFISEMICSVIQCMHNVRVYQYIEEESENLSQITQVIILKIK